MRIGDFEPLQEGIFPPSLGLALAEYTSAVANYAIAVELQSEALQVKEEAIAIAALQALADELAKLIKR